MRNAYALLGLSFIIVFGSAYILFRQSVEAPTIEAPITSENTMSLSLTSTAFANGEMIPAQYTCDAENKNPPLTIGGVPEGTESLVLVMDDPDIPAAIKESRGIEKFDHWVVYNLPADTTAIAEGELVGQEGLSSRGEVGYVGPCPPVDMEPTTHRYVFRLYALPQQLEFDAPPTLEEVEMQAKESALASAELVGVYSRAK